MLKNREINQECMTGSQSCSLCKILTLSRFICQRITNKWTTNKVKLLTNGHHKLEALSQLAISIKLVWCIEYSWRNSCSKTVILIKNV